MWVGLHMQIEPQSVIQKYYLRSQSESGTRNARWKFEFFSCEVYHSYMYTIDYVFVDLSAWAILVRFIFIT